MKNFFQAFFRVVSTTPTPLTSLKQNGCYCGRDGFLCAGISEDERTSTCLVSGCCLKCNKTVKTSYSSKMELRLNGTMGFDITWMNLPRRWIGRSTDENMALTCWPPRSPDITPCDFFLWGYIKDRLFIPPLPVSLNELKQRITTAVASVDEDMLRCVWTELDYRIDLSCDKRLTRRKFVASSYKLRNVYYKNHVSSILAKSLKISL